MGHTILVFSPLPVKTPTKINDKTPNRFDFLTTAPGVVASMVKNTSIGVAIRSFLLRAS
jgi:hypothetical protein